jgi:hypothetical protein
LPALRMACATDRNRTWFAVGKLNDSLDILRGSRHDDRLRLRLNESPKIGADILQRLFVRDDLTSKNGTEFRKIHRQFPIPGEFREGSILSARLPYCPPGQ